MKILQTCLSKSWGGMEMYTIHTALLLKKAGHETDLLCIAGSRLFDEAVKAGIKCFPVQFGFPIINGIFNTAYVIRKNKYDVVHSEASKDLWFLTPALFISDKKVPLIMTKHVGSGIKKNDILHKILYRRVNCALAISEVIRQNLIETTPLDKEKIELLHDAIDIERFDPAKTDKMKVRNEFSVSAEEIVIGMTGRFSPGKGHEEFLKAAAELNAKYRNLRFMIVGEASRGEDDYANSIKKLAADLELGNKVIFTGFRRDIPDVLSAFDIYVLPSHGEAFGLALVEAMSMGLPTVCSKSDGVLDIAVDGVTSNLFLPGNYKDLVQKIELFIEDSDKRKIYGTEGRKRAVELFGFDLFTSKLLSIYQKYILIKGKQQ